MLDAPAAKAAPAVRRRPGAFDRAADDLGHFGAHRLSGEHGIDRLRQVVSRPERPAAIPGRTGRRSPRGIEGAAAVDQERFAGSLGEHRVGDVILGILEDREPDADEPGVLGDCRRRIRSRWN